MANEQGGSQGGAEGGSRDRMVRSAAALIRSRGLHATAFSDVLAHSGAPRGSIYHHFPEGKAQLAEAAVRWTAERTAAYLREQPAATPVAVLDAFISLMRRVVVESSGAAGCAVAGVVLDAAADAPASDALLDAARDAFRGWTAVLAERLAAAGLASERAGPVAAMAVASLEGALILCRAERSAAPLDAVAGELRRLVVVDADGARRRSAAGAPGRGR